MIGYSIIANLIVKSNFMAKKFIQDSEDSTLMTSVFTIKKMLQEVRDASPIAFATLSIEELYDLILEVINLVFFIRKEVDSAITRRNNSGMKQVDSSFSNVGGLQKITVKTNPIIPFDRVEEDALKLAQVRFIELKRMLLSNSVYLFANEDQQEFDQAFDALKESLVTKFFLVSDSTPKVSNRKESNRFHYRRRRKKSS